MVFRNGFCNGFCHEIMGFRHRFRNIAFVLCNRLIGFRNRSAERTADGWAAKRAGLIQLLHNRLPFTMLKIKPHCVSTRKAAGMGRGWKNGHCETARLAPTRPACHRQEQCCTAFHDCGHHCNSFQITQAIQNNLYFRFLGCRLLFGNNVQSQKCCFQSKPSFRIPSLSLFQTIYCTIGRPLSFPGNKRKNPKPRRQAQPDRYMKRIVCWYSMFH